MLLKSFIKSYFVLKIVIIFNDDLHCLIVVDESEIHRENDEHIASRTRRDIKKDNFEDIVKELIRKETNQSIQEEVNRKLSTLLTNITVCEIARRCSGMPLVSVRYIIQ